MLPFKCCVPLTALQLSAESDHAQPAAVDNVPIDVQGLPTNDVPLPLLEHREPLALEPAAAPHGVDSDLARAAADIVGPNQALLAALFDTSFSKTPHHDVLYSRVASPVVPDHPGAAEPEMSEAELAAFVSEAAARTLQCEAQLTAKLALLSKRIAEQRLRHATSRLDQCRRLSLYASEQQQHNTHVDATKSWMANLRRSRGNSLVDMKNAVVVEAHLDACRQLVDPYATDGSPSSDDDDECIGMYEISGSVQPGARRLTSHSMTG